MGQEKKQQPVMKTEVITIQIMHEEAAEVYRFCSEQG